MSPEFMTGFKKTAGPKFEIPLFRKALLPRPTPLNRDPSANHWQSSLSAVIMAGPSIRAQADLLIEDITTAKAIKEDQPPPRRAGGS
ncbi:hypothetical protein CDAR_595871 [Caerostris darwini]|uniref:Uncharacterized protein n=1 Tax=Caerostris darwini TaxID=1538125 RepID=A0AAV4Q6E2_9ARAC|nr:hypothetical protein CDAR_595871 [Caerostris darwini]